MGISVAVFGASGYAGGELVRLIDGHPNLEVVYLGAHSKAGETLASVHPQLPGGDRLLGSLDLDDLPPIEAAFLALPHGASWSAAHQLAEANIRVFDLGSDFRMDTAQRYEQAYGSKHPLPDELARWVYGLPELFGDLLPDATRVAVPGCYPTSALLGLAPLLSKGAIEGPIVVDSMSGVSGAGRGVHSHLTFGAIDEGVRAYGVGTHRHRPEIEMGLEHASGRETVVQFTPHLVPMQRGILSTCSAALTGSASINDVLRDAYRNSAFVDVIESPPQTRWVVGSNRALIHAVEDERSGRAVVLVALDNLLKGAAGQAVQCANLALGLDEAAGLSMAGWMP